MVDPRGTPEAELAALETFVISIDPADGPRRNSAKAQLDGIGWRYRFVEGCAPDAPEVLAQYSAQLNRKKSKRPLTGGELAAYASHRLALRMFLDSGSPYGLILEDDFGLVEPQSFARRVADVLAAPVEWHLIKLYDYQVRQIAERRKAGDAEIVNYVAPTAGMVAYLASREGAQRFLSRSQVFRRIDEDTKYYWELGLTVLSVSPNPVTEISGEMGGSLLHAAREELRALRSLRRSLKGLRIVTARKLLHHWHRRRFGIRDRQGSLP